jgi:hypothetical protein
MKGRRREEKEEHSTQDNIQKKIKMLFASAL